MTSSATPSASAAASRPWARFDDDAGVDSGSAYFFDSETGDQLNKILPSDGAAGDQFGYSVGIAPAPPSSAHPSTTRAARTPGRPTTSNWRSPSPASVMPTAQATSISPI
ncbi:MAG: hypothetical protein ACFHWZ_07435 [Phycisphaerales bacterium]